MRKKMIGEKGFGIVAAVLIMLVISVMALTMVSLLGTNTFSSVNFMQSQQAFFLAESGIQRALFELSKGGGTWAGWTGTNPKTIQLSLMGYGDYDVSVADPFSDSPTITSTGYIPNRDISNKAVRVMSVVALKSNLLSKYAAFGGGSSGGSTYAVAMSGQGYSNSYDASIGRYNVDGNIGQNGDIGTNADIITSGQAYIYGDAMTGENGTFSTQSSVSGNITHDVNVELSPVIVPSSLTSLISGGKLKSTQTIASGNYKYTSIDLSSKDVLTIVGPANIYLTDNTSLDISGQAKITISPASTGPVVIYADGKVSVSGQGIENSTYLPSNLQIYGSNSLTQDIDITGQNEFYGIVYAPTGDLNLTGQGGIYGSFVGDVLTISGQGGLHHDESLANLSTPSFIPGVWEPGNWQEIY